MIFKDIFNKIINDKYIIKVVSFSYLIYATLTRIRLGTDQLSQIGSTTNFLNGNGFSTSFFNGSNITFETLYSWPLFYRIICIPFLFLNNIEYIYLFIKIFAYCILIYSLCQIFYSLFKDRSLINISINIVFFSIAFCFAPFGFGSEIDIFCVSFVLLLITKTNEYFQNDKKPAHLFFIFLYLFLLLNARYAYLPFVALYLVFLLLIDIKYKTISKYLFLKIFYCSMLSLNLILLITNPYFQKTASSFQGSSNTISSYWSFFYSVGFNALFPDYIALNFLYKFFDFDFVKNYLYFVIPVSFISIIIFLFLSYKVLKGLLKNKSSFYTIEFLLFMSGLFNLITLIYIYGLTHNYGLSQNTSIYSFIYSGLAIHDRYLSLTFSCFFILLIFYGLKYSVKHIHVLLLMSLAVGFCHSLYLTKKFNYNRIDNMKIVNLPMGSYQDCINIYNLIKKTESKKKKGLFIQGYLQDSTSYRQLKPRSMAAALGLTIFNGSKSVLVNRKKNLNFNAFNKIYFCDYTKNKNTMFTNRIYKGSVYSLYSNN
ncbi:hypothetical protein N9D17_00300 [bacterium]|nr:hypothetical protein [bacterium]